MNSLLEAYQVGRSTHRQSYKRQRLRYDYSISLIFEFMHDMKHDFALAQIL